jgi:hypothetical protein
VRREQLLALGFSTGSIEKRLAKGWLIRAHRGVYRLGHAAPSVEADYLGAVFACGSAAALSGRAAAFLLGLIGGRAPDPEVTAPIRRTVPGVETRRSNLDPRDVTTWSGIPVTTPARTLVDLAAVVTPEELARAVHQAGVLHNLEPDDVEAVLARRPNSRNAAELRKVLWGDGERVLSRLEKRFVQLLKKHDLPLPTTNRPAGGRFVDCRWPDHTLTVELDSYRYHRSRHAFEQDRKRERQAYARGDQFRRYTWGDVVEHPDPTLRELRAVLIPV